MNIIRFETLESTNLEAKKYAKQGAVEFTTILADNQTAGRGRTGKSFFSPTGGLYFSVILRPALSATDALDITTAASVACARVLERNFNIKADIKWVNDIYKNGKKICGILTESALSQNGGLEWAILGIGINLFPSKEPIPNELESIMGFVCEQPQNIDKTALCAEICEEFKSIYEHLGKKDFYSEYNSRMFLTGKKVTVLRNGTEKEALVTGTDESLGLCIKYEDGTKETLKAGEVSIRL